MYRPPIIQYPTLRRLYQNCPLRQDLQKYVINDFISIKSLPVRFGAFRLGYLVVSVCVFHVDGGAAAAAGAVVHIDSPNGAGVGIFTPLAAAPPAKS